MSEKRVFTWDYGDSILPEVNIYCEDDKGSEQVLVVKDATNWSLQEVIDLCYKKADEWRNSR